MRKIAFVTDDGETISQHFGKAQFFWVVTVNEDGTTQAEKRPKWHHSLQEQGAHGHDHGSMFQPVSDCQVLVVGGMGQPAFQAARDQGLQVILAGEKSIAAALAAFQAGILVSDPRRIHVHH